MRCERFDVRLQQLLDNRQRPDRDPRLGRHAMRCPRCRDRLTATRRLLRGIRIRRLPTLDDDFAARVVQRVAPAAGPRNASAWHLVAACVAAALLLAVFPPGLGVPRFNTWPRPDSVTPALSATAPQLPLRADPAQSPESQQSWWTVCGTSILELYPEPVRLRHRQHVSELAEELRPIATPFNATVSVLRQTIPIGRSAPKSPPSATVIPRQTSRLSHA